MCIIATKDFGIGGEFDWEKARNMFKRNPDGAGFAFTKAGMGFVEFHKGLMDFETFEACLKKYVDLGKLADYALLLHFRITTHGGTRAENTHPFPLSSNDKLLKKLNGRQPTMCAMNGIVEVDMPIKTDMSDTMHFIKQHLSFMYKLHPTFFRVPACSDYMTATGAKWAFLDCTGIEVFGAFHENANGWMYSNYTYDDYSYNKYNKYDVSAWADVWEQYESSMSDDAQTSANATGLSCAKYPMTHSKFTQFVPFEGIIMKSNCEMMEVDSYDGLYISDRNTIYFEDFRTGYLYYVMNIDKLYDEQFNAQTYEKLRALHAPVEFKDNAVVYTTSTEDGGAN